MTRNAYKRKKQPEAVKRALLDAAISIAVTLGVTGVTVQAVAAAAGVTKGGLVHHFPNKKALIEGVYLDLIDKVDRQIDDKMAQDTVEAGRFTRAYVETMLSGLDFSDKAPWAALSVTMMAEPSTNQLWTNWIEARIKRHWETDHAPMLEVVRFAADGAWFSYIDKAPEPKRLDALRAELVALTQVNDQICCCRSVVTDRKETLRMSDRPGNLINPV